ncbi:uncharacterized protein B0I36DRAFT_24562 [Microdochium trichocladiopsis]|uniref:Uncharacterized protein n=1 Tax=Microdochium trichocladiopsis TaxID=1682393 RepID=A0A9P9BV21_9PEZI|nr:uncharacterized protein B0I36DRAFT_24562 [Microdochium trichocladiopsis]KAH7041576.1 hypothetical protein B0I36DRAFT_24562 [Microdochium trichocladiopsis]
MGSIPARNRTELLRQQHIAQQQQKKPASNKDDTVLRPIITSINGNVAWIVSVPRPAGASPPSTKAYYHVVVDPWFGEPAIFVHKFVLAMTLATPPAMKNKEDVEQAIREIEAAAAAAAGGAKMSTAKEKEQLVDAFVVTGGVEHAMRTSMTQFSPSIPVFVAKLSYENVRAWNYFDKVVFLEPFVPSTPAADDDDDDDDSGTSTKGTWSSANSGAPMPEWLTILSLKVDAFNNFAIALVTASGGAASAPGSGTEQQQQGEAIILAPHGVYSGEPALTALLTPAPSPDNSATGGDVANGALARPPLPPRVLAYLGPFKDSYSLGMRTLCGVTEVLCMAQAFQDGIKYYVHNGDLPEGDLLYGGLLSYSLRDDPKTLEWGVEQLRSGKGGDGVVYGAEAELKVPEEVVVGNGESRVLV